VFHTLRCEPKRTTVYIYYQKVYIDKNFFFFGFWLFWHPKSLAVKKKKKTTEHYSKGIAQRIATPSIELHFFSSASRKRVKAKVTTNGRQAVQ